MLLVGAQELPQGQQIRLGQVAHPPILPGGQLQVFTHRWGKDLKTEADHLGDQRKKGGMAGTLVMSPNFFSRFYKIQKEISGAEHGQLHLLSWYFKTFIPPKIV